MNVKLHFRGQITSIDRTKLLTLKMAANENCINKFLKLGVKLVLSFLLILAKKLKVAHLLESFGLTNQKFDAFISFGIINFISLSSVLDIIWELVETLYTFFMYPNVDS